jgi:hypothetical protein
LYQAFKDVFRQNIVYDRRSSGTTLFFVTDTQAIGTSDNNLFYGPLVPAPTIAAQLHAWQSLSGVTFDADSILVLPGFVDYARDNFKLLHSSQAMVRAELFDQLEQIPFA